jgi:hypothetical protein
MSSISSQREKGATKTGPFWSLRPINRTTPPRAPDPEDPESDVQQPVILPLSSQSLDLSRTSLYFPSRPLRPTKPSVTSPPTTYEPRVELRQSRRRITHSPSPYSPHSTTMRLPSATHSFVSVALVFLSSALPALSSDFGRRQILSGILPGHTTMALTTAVSSSTSSATSAMVTSSISITSRTGRTTASATSAAGEWELGSAQMLDWETPAE